MIPGSLPLQEPLPDRPTVPTIYYSVGPDLEFVFLSLSITITLILFLPVHSAMLLLCLVLRPSLLSKAFTVEGFSGRLFLVFNKRSASRHCED